uniref:Chemosensory protein 16 n=1 Tax=Mythimna separata TaxID=271217 RepID=A0A1V1WBX1_MYTSE
MKTILVLCVLIAAVCARPEATYDTRYDNFDVESLVENVRLLKSYGHCFLGTGPCTAEGSAFKKTIPDALQTGCGKCSPRQRHLIRVVVNGFQTKTPDIWKQLVKKEDPNGEFKETFTRFLKASD